MVIAFIGSGNIGGAVARLAIDAGHSVVLSNSRGPETLAGLVAELGPRASAATAEEAGRAGDIVLVSVPFRAYAQVPVEPLAGKIVLDTNNYYFERDGHFAEIDNGELTENEVLARHLPTSKVVKVFNSIEAGQLAKDGTPAGTPNRRALPIAGDDAAAKRTVTELLDSFGYDVVDAGPLAESRRFVRDTPAYGPRFNAAQLAQALSEA